MSFSRRGRRVEARQGCSCLIPASPRALLAFSLASLPPALLFPCLPLSRPTMSSASSLDEKHDTVVANVAEPLLVLDDAEHKKLMRRIDWKSTFFPLLPVFRTWTDVFLSTVLPWSASLAPPHSSTYSHFPLPSLPHLLRRSHRYAVFPFLSSPYRDSLPWSSTPTDVGNISNAGAFLPQPSFIMS
jgi:hypothetical protein